MDHQDQSGRPVLTAHVVAEDECFRYGHAPGMLDALHACIADHFAVQVEHSTFQLEPQAHAGHEGEVHPRTRPSTDPVDGIGRRSTVTVLRTVVVFVLAAIAEIGGAWLIWQSVREHKPIWWAGLGVMALAAYGFIATLQPDTSFGRVLAAYGGVFVAGSLIWGIVVDKFSPDRWDITGALICLFGVAVIMFAPHARSAS